VLENNFDAAAPTKKGAGIGLNNINERLKLIYHQDNLLNVTNKDDIFSVTLYIPINEQ
jgi:sensor histidine kinase YesM